MGLLLTTIGAVLTTILGVFVGSALSNRSQTRSGLAIVKLMPVLASCAKSSNMLIELAEFQRATAQSKAW